MENNNSNKKMAKKENLKERMDTVKANSVSDKEFEETWGISIDAQVDKLMERWDTLLAQARETIDNANQPADERQQLAAQEQADSAARKEETVIIYYSVEKCPVAETAITMHELYNIIVKALKEFIVESIEKKSEKENNDVAELVVLNLSEIANPEEKEEILHRLDRATFKGVKLKRIDIMPEGDYNLLELSIKNRY
jgi:hypothetical protein